MTFFQIPLNKIPEDEILQLIEKVSKFYSKSMLNIKENCGIHEVLQEELRNEEYGESSRKHLLQQVICNSIPVPIYTYILYIDLLLWYYIQVS